MSAMTTDSAIEKAALAVTKLEGCEDWPLWSATICVAMGQTWAYVSGNQVSPPSDIKDLRYTTWCRGLQWSLEVAPCPK